MSTTTPVVAGIVDPGSISEPMRGQPAPDPATFVFGRRRLSDGLSEARLGLDADLESVDPSQQCRTETGIGVEHELVVGCPPEPGQRVDFFRLDRALASHRAVPHREIANLLRDLRLKVGLGVGA